jgi:hypothetical protein
LLLAKIITISTLGAYKIEGLTLNQLLIAPNSHKNLMLYSQQSVPCPGKKAPWLFLFFFSSKKKKIGHQSESNSVTSWNPNPWKASLHCATGIIYPCWTDPKLLA